MSDNISPIGSPSNIPQTPDETSHSTKRKLKQLAQDLQGIALQLSQSPHQPLSDHTVSQLHDTASKIHALIPQVHNAQAQSALNTAVQQIQVIVQNPDAVQDPSGKITNAYLTISTVAT